MGDCRRDLGKCPRATQHTEFITQEMLMKTSSLLRALLVTASLLAVANAVQPPTMRLDYYHTGNATTETFSFDRVVIEPLPWPGEEAKKLNRTFSESLRFPAPSASVKIVLKERREGKDVDFHEVWTTTIDPKDKFIDRSKPPSPGPRSE